MTYKHIDQWGIDPVEYEKGLLQIFEEVHKELKSDLTAEEWLDLYKRAQDDSNCFEMFMHLWNRKVTPYIKETKFRDAFTLAYKEFIKN